MLLDGNEVRAAGVLPYRVQDGRVSVLMRDAKDVARSTGELESEGFADFGGRVKPDGRSVKDIAVRKAVLESNGALSEEMLRASLRNDGSIYIERAKYQLYFCRVRGVDMAAFGDREIGNGQPHAVRWLTIAQLHHVRRHRRIQYQFRSVVQRLVDAANVE